MTPQDAATSATNSAFYATSHASCSWKLTINSHTGHIQKFTLAQNLNNKRRGSIHPRQECKSDPVYEWMPRFRSHSDTCIPTLLRGMEQVGILFSADNCLDISCHHLIMMWRRRRSTGRSSRMATKAVKKYCKFPKNFTIDTK